MHVPTYSHNNAINCGAPPRNINIGHVKNEWDESGNCLLHFDLQRRKLFITWFTCTHFIFIHSIHNSTLVVLMTSQGFYFDTLVSSPLSHRISPADSFLPPSIFSIEREATDNTRCGGWKQECYALHQSIIFLHTHTTT